MNLFVAALKSESSDRYTVVFFANKAPDSDEDWLRIIKEELPEEYDVAQKEPYEWGLGKTYLHLEHLTEINMPSSGKRLNSYVFLNDSKT